jgi:geranylgeranyl pyrophosphate synthase
MKLAEAFTLDVAPLLALLEHTFAADADGPGSHGLPRALWERALLGPLREFLARPGKELRAGMVELGFALGGGAPGALPLELPLLVEILHAGSLIVDDIEDQSELRRGKPCLHALHGVPLALNAGNWLYFWPQVLLARMALPPAARLSAHERIAECLLRCHEGQALDLAVPISELARRDVPAVARTLTALKSGKLVGLATALGAIAAGANPERVQALARFGSEVGVGLQMLDDLSGVLNAARREKALEDLRLRRVTFVWALLADTLDDAGFEALIARLRNACEQAELEEVIEQARFRLAMTGPRRVRRHFDAAIAALRRAVGGGPWDAAVRAQLARIEWQFLEAP